MPDFISIRAVDPPASDLPPDVRRALGDRYPVPDNASDHTWRTLNEQLLEIARTHPGLACRVLFRGTSDAFGIEVFWIDGAKVDGAVLELSSDRGRPEIVDAPFAAELDIRLDVAPDDVVDEIAEAAEDADDIGAGERTIRFPSAFRSKRAAAEALAVVAGHLEGAPVRAVIEARDRFYLATVDRTEGVTLTPLWLFHPDERLRTWVQNCYPRPPVEPTRVAARRVAASSGLEPSAPLTTGSARSRRDELLNLMYGDGTFGREAPRDERHLPLLIAALRAPANEGPRFAAFRHELQEQIGRFRSEAATTALIETLRDAADEDRVRVYGLLASRSDEAACQTVVRAYLDETEPVRDAVGQVVWRQDGAVELLVRELVAAWDRHRALATRIVRLFREEHILVRPVWLEGAPDELVAELRPLLEKERARP